MSLPVRIRNTATATGVQKIHCVHSCSCGISISPRLLSGNLYAPVMALIPAGSFWNNTRIVWAKKAYPIISRANWIASHMYSSRLQDDISSAAVTKKPAGKAVRMSPACMRAAPVRRFVQICCKPCCCTCTAAPLPVRKAAY